MGKNRIHGILEAVHITDIADEGLAVGRHNNMVVFVKNAVPGDVANVQVTREKRNYQEGYVVSLVQASAFRDTPFCKHFGVCGGCKWQHLKYEVQLRFKQEQVINQLKRIGGLVIPEPEPIVASAKTRGYRNKLEYTFSARRWFEPGEPIYADGDPGANALGFHVPAMFDKVVDITECYLQDEPGNAIRNYVREATIAAGFSFYNIRTQTGFMRNLIIRNNLAGQFMVLLSVAENHPDELAVLLNGLRERFPEIVSLYYAYNPSKNDNLTQAEIVHFWGDKFISEEMEGLRFAISPKSFFQTNPQQALQLYRKVREFADPRPGDIIYDLYTGTGTIALFLSASCAKVIGVEYVEEAIDDARFNARLNQRDKLSFFAGDAARLFTEEFTAQHGKPDIVVCDPPRAGMHGDVVNTLLKLKPAKIVYVSCNAATQARDMQMLQEQYRIVRLQAVDMFPHTQHTENLALLELKD